MKKKGTFASRGKTILGSPQSPQGLADFLSDSPSAQTEERVSGKTESRNAANAETRLSEGEAAPASTPSMPERKGLPAKPVREELRLTEEMGERLRRYAFDHRMKKIDVITLALEKFFRQEKY